MRKFRITLMIFACVIFVGELLTFETKSPESNLDNYMGKHSANCILHV
jgi:hypothetical protein